MASLKVTDQQSVSLAIFRRLITMRQICCMSCCEELDNAVLLMLPMLVLLYRVCWNQAADKKWC